MTTGAEWKSGVGDTWAREWARTDRAFAGLSPQLNAAILSAALAAGRAVDLGCGAGETSIAIASARPDLSITGADVSAELVRVATSRAGDRLPNLSFTQSDVAAQAERLSADVDLLFSRHGVMFFDDPASVFTTLRRAVAPHARLVFSCFRDTALNPWASALLERMTGAAPPSRAGYAPGPFGFADADWTAAMLAEAGWSGVDAQPADYSYVAGEGADPVTDAAGLFSRIGPVATVLKSASEVDRATMLERLTRAIEEHRTGDRVTFPAAAWIWSARA